MESSLRSHDGLELRLRYWPTTGAGRGCIVLVHGLGEHVDRYAAVADALATRGWAVLGFDLRGHGGSAGRRGKINHPDDFLRDLAAVIDHARTEQRGPLLLLGHSLGGAIAARFVAESLAQAPADWSRAVDGLLLSSPALDPGLRAWQRLLLAVVGHLLPDLPVHNGLDPAWISRDAGVVKAYRDDPRVHARATPRLVHFLLDAGHRVQAAAPRWRCPTLLLFAGSDRCVSPEGSRRFAAAAAPGRLQSREFPALFHEIFNEPERAEVLNTLFDWLDGFGAGQA